MCPLCVRPVVQTVQTGPIRRCSEAVQIEGWWWQSMRVPFVPYHAPGDRTLEQFAETTARNHPALLLANHGPVVAADSLSAAMDAIEELEETAKLFLILGGHPTRPIGSERWRTR